ncbi:hypothetical protein FGL91_00020 [Microbacterium sp. CBA3102]|uniref:hypothetical protein n=1 Tax=Microbacterium sp. CBA3102 TaxID=2603598 RepID=UPI0011BB2171|nr:hypothetical protein [Microbacterium sp. CBA3102]QEA27074.1 hypothetical protein FGL91_00020 [Microbacterium sp. CBA3102]
MAEQFKAIVRRRDASDDAGLDADEIWPAKLRWVSEWDRFDSETGKFISGCTSPFETHAEALAEAVHEADEVRRKNADEAAQDGIVSLEICS